MVPFQVMESAFPAFELLKEMVEKGNPSSITDAGVGALAVRSCIMGAFLNVCINASGLKDTDFSKEILGRGNRIESDTIRAEAEIIEILRQKINYRK
jgi:glutamate formiminotransferase / formiminotetrahydrofolate cyclodeaminase